MILPFPVSQDQLVLQLIQKVSDAELKVRAARERTAGLQVLMAKLQQLVVLAEHERDEAVDALIIASEVKPGELKP